MNIQEFLSQNLKKSRNLTYVPFLSEYYDAETPYMRCLSFALVDEGQQIKGFQTEIELVNDMPHSNECPCLINLDWIIDFPKLSKDQLEDYLLKIAIKFQEKVLCIMMEGKATDDLTDVELKAIDTWDKTQLLSQPAQLDEVMNYIYISNMAASWLIEHMRKWLQTIVSN